MFSPYMASTLTLRPPWTLDELRRADLGVAQVVAIPRVADRVAAVLPWPQVASVDVLDDNLDSVVVVGGGALIDEVKAWVARRDPRPTLVAVPSIWGSGAEVSPIVVLERFGGKTFEIDERFVPDHRTVWPELAGTISDARLRAACGDCWAHALEGFLSPLAKGDLRADLANTIADLQAMSSIRDAHWFELSACACFGQVRSSVGLIHGIAHTLEFPLREADPNGRWHHAKLCQAFLLPAMSLNIDESPALRDLFTEHGLDVALVFERLADLFDRDAYVAALNMLQELWPRVLRDRSTRTNSVLVKASHLAHFTKLAFA